MAPIGNIPFIGPEEHDQWYHLCSVVALDWFDVMNVTWNIHRFSYVQHLKSQLIIMQHIVCQLTTLLPCDYTLPILGFYPGV